MRRLLKKCMASLRSEQRTTSTEVEVPTQQILLESTGTLDKPIVSQKRKSRRRLLARGLGVAAVTSGVVGGALLEMNNGDATPALANGTESSTTFNNNGSSSPAVTANSTSSSSLKVNAIKATSTGFTGIAGFTKLSSLGASGVYGQGPLVGVSGQVNNANMLPTVKAGVYGTAGNQNTLNVGGVGVLGSSDTYYGVSGSSRGGGSTTDSAGVAGFTSSTSSSDAGVIGSGPNGVIGLTQNAIKDIIFGTTGVYGSGSNGSSSSPLYGTGVSGISDGGTGVEALADQGGIGLIGGGYAGPGYGYGVLAYGDYFGITTESDFGTALYASSSNLAGEFDGNVNVNGTLTKTSGAFKIDHPLDPANKFLYHSFVESPDMKNVYDGVVTLDAQGEAVVTLPDWFDALNTDFRYQLTAVGAAAPNLHIASEISNNSFTIGGGAAGMKICWQVTGNRQDPWAKAHPIPVEQDKTSSQRGHYLHPDLYGHVSDPSLIATSHAAAQQWHKLHSRLPK